MTQRDLIDVLRANCAELTQAEVARRLGVSSSAVNQLLKGTYQADPTNVLAKVERVFVFGQSTIVCPVLGDITLGKCAEKRKLPFAATNPQRVQLYRACQTCDQRGGKP